MTETRNIKISCLNNKGLTLATSIILIVFASTAVLSVTTFIIQRLSQTEAKRARTKTIYLAQAGINNAIYFYRFRDIPANGYFSLGQTNVDAGSYFVLGATPADLLMVNTATAVLTNNSSRLRNVTIQNATNSNTIVIDRMIVSWQGVPSTRRLTRMNINGRTLWTGTAASPANANLSPNFTLNTTPSSYPITELRFNGNMTGATISARFIMTDGSLTNTIQVYPASLNFNFTVKAAGKTTGSAIYRTIRADYNALTNKIFNYYEIPN